MDLYDALKNGASIEQLKGDFEKELKAAAAKIEMEDKLSDAREDAIEAFAAYLGVLLNTEPTEEDTNEVRKMFAALEKEMAPIKSLMDIVNGAAAPKRVSKPAAAKSDNDILRDFLNKMSI